MNGSSRSFVDVCRHWAAEAPARIACTALHDGADRRDPLTYAQLDRRARALAAVLRRHAQPGDRALLLYPSGIDYVVAFIGCLYAGIVAVPAYPVRAREQRWQARLEAVVRDAMPRVALTIAAYRDALDALRGSTAHGASSPMARLGEAITVLSTDDLDASGANADAGAGAVASAADGDDWRPPPIDTETLAFLQYTSGTTLTPRGVMVTHGNLLHQEAMLRQAFGVHERSVIVSWLPLYHDMGLIGSVLQTLHAGAHAVLMSPAAFLQRPLRWLQALQEFGGTISGGPNFAYDLCARKVRPEEIAALDLSTWEVAFNGSELVRAETMARFARVFAPCGFRASAFRPCYGLAEATLMVAACVPSAAGEPPSIAQVPQPVDAADAAGLAESVDSADSAHAVDSAPAVDADGTARRDSAIETSAIGTGAAGAPAPARARRRLLVTSGPVAGDQQLRIVEPETRRLCAPGAIGEVWVHGGSVARGYWRRERDTEETFRARLADADDVRAYLRTGDLGLLSAGELFIAGRLKDLIVIRGRNHFSEELEDTLASADARFRPGTGVACEIDVDDEARLLIVQEIEPGAAVAELEAAVAGIRQALLREHGLQAHAVVLVEPRSIPKTPSGKSRRRACAADIAAGRLPVVFSSVLDIASPQAAPIGDTPAVAPAIATTPARGAADGAAVVADSAQMPAAAAREAATTDATASAAAATTTADAASLTALLPPPPAADRAAFEAWVAGFCARVLGHRAPALAPDARLGDIGLDSLRATELQAAIEETLRIDVALGELLDGPSIAQLAALLADRTAHRAIVAASGTSDGVEASTSPEKPATPSAPAWPPAQTAAAASTPSSTMVSLSDGQRSMWFVETLAGASGVYTIARAGRLSGPIDLSALWHAVRTCVARHEALRMTMPAGEDGQPRAQVHAWLEPGLEEQDASAWDAPVLQRALEAFAARPFDLARGPLIRVALFRRGAEAVLALALHHIITDLWSLCVMLEEIGTLYAAAIDADGNGDPAGAGSRAGTGAGDGSGDGNGDAAPAAAAAARAPALLPQPSHMALPPPLPPLRESYTAYVARQHELLDSAAGARLRDYWHEVLAGPLEPVALATDRPRRDEARFDGGTVRTRLDAALTGELRRHAADRGVTLYVLLLAAVQTFLHRYTGQTDIIVGSPFHGRRGAQASSVVGCLTNLLPLRADFTGDPRFTAHLAAVRRRVLDALDHQAYPFNRIVDGLRVRREPGRAPLCNIVFTFQSAPLDGAWPAFAMGEPDARVAIGPLSCASIALPAQTAEFDLTLTIAPIDQELACAWNYRADLFDEATVRRWSAHFAQLLRGIARDPARPVGHYPLTDAREAAQLAALGAPASAAPRGDRLHEAFEAVAARQPQAEAIVDGARRLTYGEVNARANRLARALVRRGVGTEHRVGLFLERSADIVVSMLAVLKAGGTYVPIDPAYPAARAAFMIEDAGVGVVLTDAALAPRLGHVRAERLIVAEETGAAADGTAAHGAAAHRAADGARTLDAESDAAEPHAAGRDAAGRDAAGPEDAEAASAGGNRDQNLGLRGWPSQLAYVIYTSGSTGRPKGTLVEHRQVMRLFADSEGWFRFGPADVWTLFHSPAFDFSVWEVWGALLHGGRLVIVPYAVSRAPEQFHALLAREQVTVLNQTPSAFRLLVAADAAASDSERAIDTADTPGAASLALRLIIFGGEALDTASVRAWFARHGDARPTLVNMYGITETTVHVTYQRLTRALLADAGAGTTPIGRPLPDLRIYLLDARQQPVPVGVPGEICVGGAGLARGYGGRPALTAARFVPDPFGGDGGRLYRSGDQARFAADGTLQYLGRLDDQVKIRGFRVELGEIEATLLRHPGVADCRVIAADAAADPAAGADAGAGIGIDVGIGTGAGARAGETDRRLVAYIVPAPGAAFDPAALRAHAAATLADYLLPQAFVCLARMPLTAHGKLDRAALPAPTGERPAGSDAPIAPRTAAERTLCAIWQRVLEVQQVGTADNFFELGGDSIRCLQVVSRARAEGLPVTVQQMLRHQTVADLARVLAARGSAVATSEAGVPEAASPDAAMGEAAPPDATAPDGATPDDAGAIGSARAAASGLNHAAPAPVTLLSPDDERRLAEAGIADYERAYPLTTVQAGLIFHSEYEPDYVVYSISVSLRARFDEGCFREAIALLIRRHPLLRTSYDMTSGSEPLQIVHRGAPVPLVVQDLRHLSKAERDRLLADWIEREKRLRFDWRVAPLFRVYLHRLDDETFQFTFSHSLFDGWSTAIASTELFELYFARLRGEAPSPDGPATAFHEFVALERHALGDPETRAFWDRALSGEPQGLVPRWPTPLRASVPARATSTMPDAVFAGLAALARRAHVPLKSVFLAAHLRALTLITGQPDIVTGVITNGRVEGVGTDRVLGMFLNAVPLRMTLAGGRWRDLVQAVFAAEQQTFPFRRYPFAELQRQRGRQPLFETAFNIINFHVYRDLVRDTGLQVVDRLTSYDQTFFALTAYFEVDAFSSAAYVHLDVNSRDLGDPQLAAIQGCYGMVLAAMAAAPDARYDETATLLDSERTLLLERWRGAPVPYPDRGVEELFAETARRRPQHVAVKSRGRALTYAALQAQAARVARRIAAAGVGREDVVAICVERSTGMLAGLLGILTAGAAYLPLDASLPPERLAYMLADSGARLVLASAATHASLPQDRPETILLDRVLLEGPLIEGAPLEGASPDERALDEAGDRRARAANLAYVIYTSGSTGAPKAVQVTRGALTNLVCAMAREPGFGEDDVLLALTTLSFDIAGLELFVPIVAGGTVAIGEQIDVAPDALQAQIAASGATVLQATPTTWRLLVESGWAGQPSLTLLCGGEPLPRDLADALLERGAALWNMYGPTETTIWSTCGRVAAGPGAVTVGRPIANTTAYVLDRALRLVPIGATGELHLAGDGLARGYRARAGLTAERMRPNPFDAAGGGRMYATGDLARVHPDGAIELLGRADQQVKIRGMRIEPGEIEAVLSTHAGVRQAAVLAREHGAGDVRLVAFVVPSGADLPAAGDLRAWLKQTLPDYMIPAQFVPIDALPVTANGKRDRRALLALEREPAFAASAAAAAATASAAEAPLTPLEQQVAGIWEAVLERAPIGAHEDFFELGGHSLLAMRVIARLRAALDLPIPLTALFEASTVAGLAAVVEAVQAEADAEVDSLLAQIDALSDRQVQDRLVRDRLSLSDPA